MNLVRTEMGLQVRAGGLEEMSDREFPAYSLQEIREVKDELSLIREDIRALRAVVAKKSLGQRSRDDRTVLRTEEAVAYVGHRSGRTFRRWARRYGVVACSPGRYTRLSLDRALRKELQCWSDLSA